jgi:hypothetical protein
MVIRIHVGYITTENIGGDEKVLFRQGGMT